MAVTSTVRNGRGQRRPQDSEGDIQIHRRKSWKKNLPELGRFLMCFFRLVPDFWSSKLHVPELRFLFHFPIRSSLAGWSNHEKFWRSISLLLFWPRDFDAKFSRQRWCFCAMPSLSLFPAFAGPFCSLQFGDCVQLHHPCGHFHPDQRLNLVGKTTDSKILLANYEALAWRPASARMSSSTPLLVAKIAPATGQWLFLGPCWCFAQRPCAHSQGVCVWSGSGRRTVVCILPSFTGAMLLPLAFVPYLLPPGWSESHRNPLHHFTWRWNSCWLLWF